MSRTPTSRGAHCPAHATQRGACAGCQRARIAAAQQQLALVSVRTVAGSAHSAGDARSMDQIVAV